MNRTLVIAVDLTGRAADIDGYPIPVDSYNTPTAAAVAHLTQLAAQIGHPIRARITHHHAHTSIPLVIDPTGHRHLDLDGSA